MENEVAVPRRFSDHLKKSEPFIFFIIVLLNAWPLFTSRFYLTHDGPAHLYNSVLIKELIFGKDVAIHQLFQLNPILVPNMTSHVLMAILESFLPIWLAEKIILLTYFIGLPYFFRYFLRKAYAPALFFSTLIIPITYSFFFYLGFYNFLLALLPLFLMMSIWSNENKRLSWKLGVQLFLSFLLLYFSHIYVFAFALLVAGMFTVIQYLKHFQKSNLKRMLMEIFFLSLTALPFLILILLFIHKTAIITLPIQPSFHELARSLMELSSINRPGNFVHHFTSKIAVVFALLILIGIAQRFIRFRNKKSSLIVASDAWIIASALLLVLYFIVPDYMGGGMNCLRIQQLLVISSIAWICLQAYSRSILAIGIGATLLIQTALVGHYALEKNHSAEIAEWIKAGEHLTKGSITLPIVFSEDEQWIHTSGYMGATSRTALYANYEAGLQWFPIIWNNEFMIRLKGLKARNPLTDDRNPAVVWSNKKILYPDRVVVWGQPTLKSEATSFHEIDSILHVDFTMDYQSQNLKLYKLKK